MLKNFRLSSNLLIPFQCCFFFVSMYPVIICESEATILSLNNIFLHMLLDLANTI